MEAAASRSMDPRDRSEDALLTEILPEPVKPSAPASVSSDNGSGSSPSSGSYVHVEEEVVEIEVEPVIEEILVGAAEIREILEEAAKEAAEVVVEVADPVVPSLAE